MSWVCIYTAARLRQDHGERIGMPAFLLASVTRNGMRDSILLDSVAQLRAAVARTAPAHIDVLVGDGEDQAALLAAAIEGLPRPPVPFELMRLPVRRVPWWRRMAIALLRRLVD